MRFRTAAALTATLMVPAASVALAGPALAADAQVTVVHGIPDVTVDVYANGEILLDDFAPGTVTDPVALPEGSYDIAITASDAAGADDSPVLSETVDVPGGANASVVAHLSEGGDPTLTTFVNDTSEVAAGEARLTVRHTAAAPAVDVLANGDVLFSNLSNPNEAKGDVPEGTYSASVVPTGATEPVVLGPADVALTAGTNTIVYAWGSLDDENLALAVQTVDGLGGAPHGVPSGTGAAADETFPVWAAGAMAIAAVGVAASGAAVARARSRS